MKPLHTLTALGAALWLAAAPLARAAQTVNITGTTQVTHAVCGNASNTTTGDCATLIASDGNTVTVSNSAGVTGRIYGNDNVSATAATTVAGNQVSVSNGTVTYVYGGVAESAASGLNAKATNNTVTLSGATTSADGIGGGMAYADDNATASATSNTVTVTGGAVDGIEGADVEAGVDGSANATGNIVQVSGGAVTDGIDGAYVYCDVSCSSIVASGNQVLLTGGSVEGGIFGGFVDVIDAGQATDNVVDVGAGVSLDPDVDLAGGQAATSTGNVLNLRQAAVEVDGVDYFQKLNFFVPASFTAGKTMLTATTANLNYADAAVTFTVASGSPLKAGDTIVLISGALTLPATPIAVTNGQGYTFDVTRSATALSVKLTGVPPAQFNAGAGATAVPTLGATALALLAALLGLGAALFARERGR